MPTTDDAGNTAIAGTSAVDSRPVPTLELTLNPDVEVKNDALPPSVTDSYQKPQQIDDAKLTPEEQKQVDDFAKTIDITNPNVVLLYGAGAQKKIADFSDSALNSVRTKDLGEAGDLLTNLVVQLKTFNTSMDNQKKGFFSSLFGGAQKQLDHIKADYGKVEGNVDNISGMLETHQRTLLKDVALLDRMYEMNKTYFRELTLYIAAGQQKLDEARTKDLPALQEKAKQSGQMIDAQAANDYASMCDRFEKKLYDLKLTRQIAIQMAPQIRLVQGNDSLLVEKIQTSIVNTIPLWKSQMLLTLGLAHSKQALEAQRAVTDFTNEMLKRNAEMLKQSTIDTAKESERGIVEIETLQQTNQALISTFDEVIKIQDEGRAKRRDAEVALGSIEQELKGKLLQLRDGTPNAPASANSAGTGAADSPFTVTATEK